MCGIFALLNNNETFATSFIKDQFEKGRGRGPEHSVIKNLNVQSIFGFHRLAINGINPESNQPIQYKDISLICNGEIYNYNELYKMMKIRPTTDSDCEVIIHLYLKYGIEHTIQMLDGVFAFILMDSRMELPKHKIFVARDPYGVRPLFWFKPTKIANPSHCFEGSVINKASSTVHIFASEMKSIVEFYKKTPSLENGNESKNKYEICAFKPGHFVEFKLPWVACARWKFVRDCNYHSTGFKSCIPMNISAYSEKKDLLDGIQRYLMAAVFKRCCTTDRPIACLLSGGLDSSLIAALVTEYHRIHELPTIETYSIGLEGSEDLKCARLVADYIGSNHTEIIITEQDFIDAVPHVIKAIESYDTTTVRASLGNWLIGKYISENSDAKVIFNGDGSDELCGGYLYMHACPDPIEFDRESRRLLKDIHQFDVLRSDRCISSHGLEPRTPFLDRSWVQYYLSIDPELRYHVSHGKKEKYLLRLAFSNAYFTDSLHRDLLPPEILWRRKEAFSDGVSLGTRSLYQILQEHALTISYEIPNDVTYDHNSPVTMEQKWYRDIFESEYPGLAYVIPYFWMPKYVEAKDASARTLTIYTD